MPREQINYPDAVEHCSHICGADSSDAPAGGGKPWYENVVQVRWHAAGHDRVGNVQVSLQAPIAAWGQMADDLREAEAHKDETVKWEEGWMPEAYSPSLSRSEINKLIAVLRKARDQAYGRDE